MGMRYFIHKIREQKRIKDERMHEMQLNVANINPTYRASLSDEEKTLYKKMWGGN